MSASSILELGDVGLAVAVPGYVGAPSKRTVNLRQWGGRWEGAGRAGDRGPSWPP